VGTLNIAWRHAVVVKLHTLSTPQSYTHQIHTEYRILADIIMQPHVFLCSHFFAPTSKQFNHNCP